MRYFVGCPTLDNMTQIVASPQFDIHDRLRKAREHAKLTQAELAEVVGIARSSVSNYEAAAITRPRKIVLKAWALATGVDYEWLASGKAPAGGTDTVTDTDSLGYPESTSDLPLYANASGF